jgi:hypothetical protein
MPDLIQFSIKGWDRDRIACINDIEPDPRNPPSPDFVAQLAAVLGTTSGSPVLRRTAPVRGETGRSFASADCGRLARPSEGNRQKP